MPRPSSPPITPLPIPRTTRSVLLVGGVFDPPHKAHVDLPRDVRDRWLGGRAWLVYVPAARSPHKPDGPVASDAQRIRMLRLALARSPRVAIWTDEIERGGASYWIETIRRAAGARPSCAIRFLIGSDQAAAFHRWKRPREILSLAEPIVLLRPPHRSAAAVIRAMRASKSWTGAELEQWATWIDDSRTMNVSSTRIRRDLAAGRASPLVPAAVRAYIRRHGLYRPRATSPLS